jgi:hypothetical protein
MVLLSDNFNLENGGSWALNYSGFANWDVSNGTVDLIGDGSSWPYLPPGNGLYLDMDGSTGDAGKITTKTSFDLTPGVSYVLSFDLAGNQIRDTSETITVQIATGTVLDKTYTVFRTDPLTTITEIFTVAEATSGKLSFEVAGGDNVGPLLDNVSLTVVPLPAAGLIGMLGLGVAGWKLRKFVSLTVTRNDARAG